MMKRNTRICVIAAAGVLAITSAVAIWKGRSAETTHGLHLNFTDESVEACRFGNRMTVPDSLDCATWNVGCESEHGYYFIARAPEGHFVVSFADRETGTTLPLCPRPNCTHNGNEFCTATSYNPRTHMQYYDGYLYAVTTVNVGGIQANTGTVLRFSPDGTEVTPFAHFDMNKDFFYEHLIIGQPVVHRGYLWFLVESYNFDKKDPDISEDDLWSGGFEIIGCELATGKCTQLYANFPADAISSLERYHCTETLMPDGDFLYMSIQKPEIDRECLPKGMRTGTARVSLHTGIWEWVDSRNPVAVADEKLYFVGSNVASASVKDLYVSSFGSKEKQSLGSLPEDCRHAIITDGTMVYQVFANDKTWSSILRITAMDGTVKGELEIPDLMVTNVSVKDDTVYLYAQEKESYTILRNLAAYTVPLADVLEGHAKPKLLYQGVLATEEQRALLTYHAP